MFKILKLAGLFGFVVNINTMLVSAQAIDMVIQKEGFSFELKGCNNVGRLDKPLQCDFTVQNIEDGTRKLEIRANRSRVIDEEGNEIVGSTVNLGNKGDDSSASSDLVNGVPLNGSITFAKQPTGKLRLVDFSCYAKRSFNAEFVF